MQTELDQSKPLGGGSTWARVDRWMRSLHLYTGLLLVPWMAMYATSAFCLNHNSWFTPWLGKPQTWELVRETAFTPEAALFQDPAKQAKAVLQAITLDGPYRIQGQPTTNEMVIYRYHGGGDYLVTWRRSEARITVQQQRPASLYRYLHFLHFIRGNEYPYGAAIAWAITVDVAAISTWFWVVSGIYIWARRPNRRGWGWLCLIGGGLVFLVLAILICR